MPRRPTAPARTNRSRALLPAAADLRHREWTNPLRGLTLARAASSANEYERPPPQSAIASPASSAAARMERRSLTGLPFALRAPALTRPRGGPSGSSLDWLLATRIQRGAYGRRRNLRKSGLRFSR